MWDNFQGALSNPYTAQFISNLLSQGNQGNNPSFGQSMMSLAQILNQGRMGQHQSQNQPQNQQQTSRAPALNNMIIGNASGNVPYGTSSKLSSSLNDRLAQYRQGAAEAYPNNPMMQQVALSQALLESGINKPSGLAQRNNFFGIKAPGTAGITNMKTTEYVNGRPETQNAGFGANLTPADSFNQHRGLMAKNRYQSVQAASSPEQAFQALSRSGYATDPRYAQKLNQIYSRYIKPMYTQGSI